MAGVSIDFGYSPILDSNNTSLAGTSLATLTSFIGVAGQVEYGDDGTNTYLVVSDNGSATAGHVTIIELVGVTLAQISPTVNGTAIEIF